MTALSLSLVLPQELLDAVRREARAEAERAVARAIAEIPRAESPPEVEYMRAAAYAKRRAISKRTLETLIKHGLPTEGRGRLRRIPVARADEWLQAWGTRAAQAQAVALTEVVPRQVGSLVTQAHHEGLRR